MDKFLQIATQKLGLKGISRDHHNSSPIPRDEIIFWFESRQSRKGSFRQSSLSQLLNLTNSILYQKIKVIGLKLFKMLNKL
jgi:hypothetical protein